MAVRSGLHNRNQEAQRQRRDTAGMVLGLAMIATGLGAGLLYSYACSVLPGLGQTSDRTFIDAMRRSTRQSRIRSSSRASSGRSRSRRWPQPSSGVSGRARRHAGPWPRSLFTHSRYWSPWLPMCRWPPRASPLSGVQPASQGHSGT